MTPCSKIITFYRSCEFNTFRSNPDQIPGRWCIIHTSLSTSTPDTRLTLLLWKRAHILAKSAIFCKAVVMSTHFRGPTSMLIFWNYITLYFRASFHHFSNILTSFRRGDFIPTRKRTTEILTQIRQSFCKRRSKSFIEKLSDFTFAADFGHKKNCLLGTFYFRNQLIWVLQWEKQTEGLERNNDQKNYSKNITAALAARCCMRLLVSV